MIELSISLGSNFKDRKKNVENGLVWLKKELMDIKCSGIYETPEIHGQGRSYFNSVVIGFTTLSYVEFNNKLKEYEIEAGRTADARSRGEVVIDLDIVVWNKEIIRPGDFSREFFQIGWKEVKGANTTCGNLEF